MTKKKKRKRRRRISWKKKKVIREKNSLRMVAALNVWNSTCLREIRGTKRVDQDEWLGLDRTHLKAMRKKKFIMYCVPHTPHEYYIQNDWNSLEHNACIKTYLKSLPAFLYLEILITLYMFKWEEKVILLTTTKIDDEDVFIILYVHLHR